MTSLSTQVVDVALGVPAARLRVKLHGSGGEVARGKTDADGIFHFEAEVEAGPYALEFATARWFASTHRPTLFPAVQVMFTIEPGEEHVNIGLLLSPHSYTTYRAT